MSSGLGIVHPGERVVRFGQYRNGRIALAADCLGNSKRRAALQNAVLSFSEAVCTNGMWRLGRASRIAAKAHNLPASQIQKWKVAAKLFVVVPLFLFFYQCSAAILRLKLAFLRRMNLRLQVLESALKVENAGLQVNQPLPPLQIFGDGDQVAQRSENAVDADVHGESSGRKSATGAGAKQAGRVE